ncbi:MULTISPECIES: hypothetical protein [Pontibacillus]|uniref:Uncharacterized protein n=1 Tax=Pontibacillus chungwhensis TaxID=265426 RepID=A0ABY8UVC1_9BACI|nr:MULTISPECIES: hypothetical protein [Pontibacillus]WIF97429.1 hypothetical protein QNI29_17090 [Pontibacillus chungwhensis]
MNLNYTSEMEKAMHQSHGIGYQEYSRRIDQRLKVEQRREAEYQASRQIVAEVDRQIHR